MEELPREDLKEYRFKARLAWNGWPDTTESRERLQERENSDPYSACAWDKVVLAILLHNATIND